VLEREKRIGEFINRWIRVRIKRYMKGYACYFLCFKILLLALLNIGYFSVMKGSLFHDLRMRII